MKKHVFYFELLKMQAMKGMKIWLVMVALVMMVGSIRGQGWLRTFGEDSSNSTFHSTGIIEPDGLLLFSGTGSYGTGDTSFFYVVKMDWEGEIIYENILLVDPAINNLLPTKIQKSDDGGYFVFSKARKIGGGTFPALVKLSSDFDVQWVKYYNPIFGFESVAMEDYPTGGLILVTVNNNYLSYLSITDENGDTISVRKFENQRFDDLLVNNDSTIIVVGLKKDSTTQSGYSMLVKKIDSNNNEIWNYSFGTSTTTGAAKEVAKRNNGGYIMYGYSFWAGTPFVFAIDENGILEWYNNYSHADGIQKIIPTIDGYILVGGDIVDKNLHVIKIDEEGELIWRKKHILPGLQGGGIPLRLSGWEDNNGNIYVSGTEHDTTFSKLFLYKFTPNGILYTSALTGTVHHDPESDCLPDPTEPGLAGWLVQATGTQSFATLTDSFGNFTLPVDTGSYEVTIAPPGPYWEVCNSPFSVDITAFYDTLSLDFPAQAIADCPYLTVDISAPFLRRCFDNHYYVHYCNDGTASANDATVEVTLDPYFTYVSSTLPLASQNGNTLSFDLGDVAVNDCGSFQITAHLDCDSTILGQTHCTSAHISPDSLCLSPDPLWDGSSIEVDVSCSVDSVVFTITNVGTGGMPAPLGYIIIEDQIVLMTDEFQLGPGQSTTVTVPANGSTFRLEAQQALEHPSGFASTGATIEGCGGWMSLGFFTQWSFDDDPDPFTDVDCQANIGSFDPNDKQGFPAGFTDEHLIEPGQDIEYLIRFQNTGTDTAFKVTVVDVLPPELDLSTVRPGASSHPYTYGVTTEGWLTFTFDNIQLPDSTTNEAASHGFVRFRASQRPGLGSGNIIANTALIYFDFNAPVQTNTYKHRIGQVFPWTVVGTKPPVFHPKTQVRIVPNPLTYSALLQVEGIEPGPLKLVLTDISGKVLRQQTVNGTGFEFQRGELNPGLYFFKIDRNGEQVGSGKLMVK